MWSLGGTKHRPPPSESHVIGDKESFFFHEKKHALWTPCLESDIQHLIFSNRQVAFGGLPSHSPVVGAGHIALGSTDQEDIAIGRGERAGRLMGNIARNFTPRPIFFAHFDADPAFNEKNFASCREDRFGRSNKHSRRVGLPHRATVGRCKLSAMTENLAVKSTPPAHAAVFLKGHNPGLEIGSIGKIIPRGKNGLHIASEKKGIGPFVHRNSECGSDIVARGISRISTGSVAGGFRFGKESIVRHGTFSHVAVSIGHEAFKLLFRLRAQVASARFESKNLGFGPVGLLVFV